MTELKLGHGNGGNGGKRLMAPAGEVATVRLPEKPVVEAVGWSPSEWKARRGK